MYRKETSRIIALCLVVVLIALAGVIAIRFKAKKITDTSGDSSYAQAASSNEEIIKSQKSEIEVKNNQINGLKSERASLVQQLNNPFAKPTTTTTVTEITGDANETTQNDDDDNNDDYDSDDDYDEYDE